MRPALNHKPEARVTILTTLPTDFSNKALLQFTTFDQVASNISMDGMGSATVTFFNKRLSFFRGIRWPQWARAREDEIELIKSMVDQFKDQTTDPMVHIPYQYIEKEHLLHPRINPFDFIWIDYRGRDGLWYAGFSGMITGYKDTYRAKGTPTFTITAKDFRRVLQFTPIITGLNNIAQFKRLDTILTENQANSPVVNNIFAGKSPAAILGEVINTVNDMLNIEPEDLIPFWRYRQPNDTTGEIGVADEPLKLFAAKPPASDVLGIRSYEYIPDEFDLWEGRKDPDAVASVFYRNPLGFAFQDALFVGGPSVYQQILRAQLDLLTVDYEPALSIMNKIAQVTLSSIYVDQAGNLRYEYPRYATLPSTSEDVKAPGNINGVEDEETLWHGRNYWVTGADRSFLSYSGGEDESEIVATRVLVSHRFSLGMAQLPDFIIKDSFTGYATASESDILRFGLREANLPTFFSNTQMTKDVLDSYAEATRLYLNIQSRSFTIGLNQRPDTMLNRTMVYMDRARVGLITDISDAFSPTQGHTRTHTCRYARFLGEPIDYPWKGLLDSFIDDESPVPVVRGS